MTLLWFTENLLIPAAMSLATGVYTGFLVGRIFAFEQGLMAAQNRVAEMPDRIERVVHAATRTEAERVFQLFFHDIAQPLKAAGQTRAAHDLTTISLELQTKVLEFWDYNQRQRANGVPTTRIVADIQRFALEAFDAVSADVGAVRPQWAVLILGRWRVGVRRKKKTPPAIR